jgi:fumarate reductase subunit C
MSSVVGYRRRVPVWWWTRKRTYFIFVMRELSSVFIAWFVVYLLRLISAVGDGPKAYADFLDWASSAWVVVLNVVALAFVVLHAITWFSLTPQAMAVRLRGRPVPASVIIASQYAGLAVASAVVFWLVTS